MGNIPIRNHVAQFCFRCRVMYILIFVHTCMYLQASRLWGGVGGGWSQGGADIAEDEAPRGGGGAGAAVVPRSSSMWKGRKHRSVSWDDFLPNKNSNASADISSVEEESHDDSSV